MDEALQGRFQCGKCGHHECETGELRASGSMLASVFDIEGRSFSSVTCSRCQFTEFYRVDRDKLSSVFDLFVT